MKARLTIVNPALTGPVPAAIAARKTRRRFRPPLGLGDLVRRFADPIARYLDAQTKAEGRFIPRTRLSGCSACAMRRSFLNRVVPNVWSRADWLGAPKRLVAAATGSFVKKPGGKTRPGA